LGGGLGGGAWGEGPGREGPLARPGGDCSLRPGRAASESCSCWDKVALMAQRIKSRANFHPASVPLEPTIHKHTMAAKVQ